MKEMIGYVYSWFVEDEINAKGEKEISLRAYLLSENSQDTYLLHIDRFQPWIYLEIQSSHFMDWTSLKTSIRQQIIAKAKRLSQKTFYLSYRKKLYDWQEEKEFPFFKLRCISQHERRSLVYQLHQQVIRVQGHMFRIICHEQDVSPLLQLLVSKQLPSAGWIAFHPSPVKSERKLTSLEHEWEVHYEDVKCLSESESIQKGIPSPCILSFDLEVYSSNRMRMPDAKIDTDCIFQISCCFQKENTTVEYLLSLGKLPRNPSKTIHYEWFDSEKELLQRFVELLRYHEVHVCIGYNIFGFDIPYLIERSRYYRIFEEWNRMGFPLWKHSVEKNISWSSSAYSYQEFHFLDTEGRIWIDLLPVIRRDYKFSNYKLKTVSTYFLGETKDPLTASDIFQAYETGVLNPSEEGQRNLERCGKYCLQDSRLVLKLFNMLNLWIGLSEMAKICHVPIMDLFTKGQQIKVYSQIFAQCYQDNRIVESHLKKEDTSTYKGAYVFPPNAGVYDWVIPFDFSSLYPTTIIAYNIDYSTFIRDESKIKNVEDYHRVEWEDHIQCEHDESSVKDKKKQTVCQHYRYFFRKEPKGVIPRLLIHLLDQRQKIKDQLKQCSKDDKRRIIYDKQQLAYKLSANSAYGIMGFQKGYLPFQEGAMSVTAMGRSNIQKAAHYVQTEHRGQLIYGDSVTGDTPLLLLNSKQRCEIRSIEDWYQYFHSFETEKEWVDLFSHTRKDRIDIESRNYQILSKSGWSTVKRVIRHWTHKTIYRVWTTTGFVDVTEDHSLVLSNGQLSKPQELRWDHECKTIDRHDLENHQLLCPDHVETMIQSMDFQKTKRIRWKKKEWEDSKILLQFIYLLFLQRFPHMQCQVNDQQEFEWILHPDTIRSSGLVLGVQTISALEKGRYVYDIETTDGTFHAGVGNVIVKNTDSIYCHFPNMITPNDVWTRAKSIEKEFLRLFPSPMKLVFEEKIYQKFLILTKKRYMAFTCDQRGERDKELTIRGVLLARRDNCLWIRDFYEKVVFQIMESNSVSRILDWINQRILDLFSWHPDFRSKKNQFVVSKIVNKDYKVKPLPTDIAKWKLRLQSLHIQDRSLCPTSEQLIQINHWLEKDLSSTLPMSLQSFQPWVEKYMDRSKPGHVQLAQKCRLRGQPIEAGSRIEYVIIEHVDPHAKLCDKMEDPDYFFRYCFLLRIDRFYYLKLLAIPMDQLLQVSLKLTFPFVDRIYDYHWNKKKCLRQLMTLFQPRLSFPKDRDRNHLSIPVLEKKKKEKTSSIYDYFSETTVKRASHSKKNY